MDTSKNRQIDHLGVNKVGKNIKKSPIHQPNVSNNANRQQPQPQVYNISKNDFRNIVQQLTGSPSPHRDPLPRPPQNPPKPQSNRLQKIRPPPLAPFNNRPHIPPPVPVAPAAAPPPVPHNNNGFARPGQFGPPPPAFPVPQRAPADAAWANTAESPISAYMRYLQNSIMNPSPGPGGIEAQQQFQQSQPPAPGQMQNLSPSSGLLPNPPMPAIPAPRMNGPAMPMPNLPSPHMNGPPPLPSPTSQFLLPSPTGYLNFLSPRSPYPPLSPGMQFPPMTPNFSFSPMGQPGVLGPGPQPPLSPGYLFPLSPSGFFPVSSPRWPQ